MPPNPKPNALILGWPGMARNPATVSRPIIEEMARVFGTDKRSEGAFVDRQKQAHQKALDPLSQNQSAGSSQPLKDFGGEASTVAEGRLGKLDNLSR